MFEYSPQRINWSKLVLEVEEMESREEEALLVRFGSLFADNSGGRLGLGGARRFFRKARGNVNCEKFCNFYNNKNRKNISTGAEIAGVFNGLVSHAGISLIDPSITTFVAALSLFITLMSRYCKCSNRKSAQM